MTQFNKFLFSLLCMASTLVMGACTEPIMVPMRAGCIVVHIVNNTNKEAIIRFDNIDHAFLPGDYMSINAHIDNRPATLIVSQMVSGISIEVKEISEEQQVDSAA